MKFFTKDIVAITFYLEDERSYELETTNVSIIVSEQEKCLQAYGTGMEEGLYQSYPNKKIDKVILTWYRADVQGQKYFEEESILNVKSVEFWLDSIYKHEDSGIIPWKIEFSWDVKQDGENS